MSYRQLLANLEALPEEGRQLAAYFYEYEGVCGCVLGKGIPGLVERLRAVAGGDWNDRSIEDHHEHISGLLQSLASFAEVAIAQGENDRFPSYGADNKNAPALRRERYTHMVEWLRVRVAKEVTSAASAHEVRPQGLPLGGHPGCAGGLCEEES